MDSCDKPAMIEGKKQVAEASSKLEEAVKYLSLRIEELEKGIADILIPEKDGVPGCGNTEHEICPLAKYIDRQAENISDVSYKINSLISRIQL